MSYNNGRFADIPPADIPPDSGSFIERLFGGSPDSDRLLILSLMFMLVREGADMKLILALAYILL